MQQLTAFLPLKAGAKAERANALARGEASLEPANGNQRPHSGSKAAVARLPEPRTNGHAAAYLGAGAVVLGLLCLILLGQLTF
jgi:hypothetical protein